MSDIKTVTLGGAELKVEGLSGQNTVIVNRGSAALYASVSANVTPDGDNTAAIPAGGVMNLYGTNGTVYLLGTGKVELEGTDYSDIGRAAVISSGGSSSGGVSKKYVDSADAANLRSAKKYTDDEIAAVEEKIPVIPEALPADGGNAETAKTLTYTTVQINAESSSTPRWIKIANIQDLAANRTIIANLLLTDIYHLDIGHNPENNSDNINGMLYIAIRPSSIETPNLAWIKLYWEWASDDIRLEDVVLAFSSNEDGTAINGGLFVNLQTHYNTIGVSEIMNNNPEHFILQNSVLFVSDLSEYTTIVPSVVANLLNTKDLENEVADLKGYIGYTDSDIYGLEADFENNRFTRLAGAVGKNPGADFDNIQAFGGRRRCAIGNDGVLIAYYGDDNYEEDGNIAGQSSQCMVEQPKFYYKVVPLKTERIEGADGYHLRKARYYISDTPKPGFKVHPAFIQNGVEVDKIYLSSYEASTTDVSASAGNWNDTQDVDFDHDWFISKAGAKPTSGTTQALTRANSRKLAQNIGTGWGITTIQTLSATQLLFAIEYATFDSQTAIGNGVVNATETIRTGSTSSLGNASGSVESGGVSYRGEENLWGNIGLFVDGINGIMNKYYIADHDFADNTSTGAYEDSGLGPVDTI